MNTITKDELRSKLIEHNVVVDIDGEEITTTCPNELIKCKGKPDIVRLFYNNRWYYWEIVG